MSDFSSLKFDLKNRMNKAVDVLKQHFAGLRTGRASVNLLDGVIVNAYGSQMPINQVGSIGVPEPRLITISVWDKGLVGSAEKAIRDADLGLNPAADGSLIRIAIPALTEERRKELVKVAHQFAEEAKVAIRNIRRDGMDALKDMEKNKEISEDEHKTFSEDVQRLTDEMVKEVDDHLEKKEKDIMVV